MDSIERLLSNNKRWAAERKAEDAEFFRRHVEIQRPKYLWIGCSDSRMPASQLVDLQPGEIFVHRNVANLFIHTDMNCLSVLEFAVKCLHIEHVIVCGHYGCGGVAAAMSCEQHGITDNWLRNIRDIYTQNKAALESLSSHQERYDRLVELSVKQQVHNISHTTVVHNAWAQGQSLSIHAWVYVLEDGILRDLGCTISGPEAIDPIYLTRHCS